MAKFQEIAQDLSTKIKTNFYQVGTYLPSEYDLANHYGVSRETIRKAQNMLLASGYIQKQRGKGAIVLDHERFSFPISGLTSYKEIQTEQGFQTQTQVVLNERIKAPEFLLGEDDIQADEWFIHLVRCRKIAGTTEIIDEDFLRESIVGPISNSIGEDSIYSYFEDELGLIISFASKEIIATQADDYDQKYLKLSATDHIIRVNSYVYLGNAQFFQYTSSHHRLDKFRFAEFARRRSIIEQSNYHKE